MFDHRFAPIPIGRSRPAVGFQIMNLDALVRKAWPANGQIIVGPGDRQLFRLFFAGVGVQRQIMENKNQIIEREKYTTINLLSALLFSIFRLVFSHGASGNRAVFVLLILFSLTRAAGVRA